MRGVLAHLKPLLAGLAVTGGGTRRRFTLRRADAADFPGIADGRALLGVSAANDYRLRHAEQDPAVAAALEYSLTAAGDGATAAVRAYDLGALDGWVVLEEGPYHTATFQWAPWGRHWSTPGPVVTARLVAQDAEPADIGGGAATSEQVVDVEAYWPDADALADPDSFRDAVEEAVQAAVRARETTLGAAFFTFLEAAADAAELLPGRGARAVRHGLVLTLRAKGVHVYA